MSPTNTEGEREIWLADYRAAHQLLNQLEVSYADKDGAIFNLPTRIRELLKEHPVRPPTDLAENALLSQYLSDLPPERQAKGVNAITSREVYAVAEFLRWFLKGYNITPRGKE